MTTVAYKDGYMAADRGIVSGETFYPSQTTKVFCIAMPNGKKALVGYCGSITTGQLLVRWACEGFQEGEFPGVAVNDDTFNASLLVVTECGEIFEYEKETPMTLSGDIAAIGSGGPLASASMLAGSSAAKAVEIASQLDLYTLQGPVDIVSFQSNPINK